MPWPDPLTALGSSSSGQAEMVSEGTVAGAGGSITKFLSPLPKTALFSKDLTVLCILHVTQQALLAVTVTPAASLMTLFPRGVRLQAVCSFSNGELEDAFKY